MVIGGVVLMITTKLDVMNHAEIQKNGLEALKSALGVTATVRFLEQFDKGGFGDYTEEKYQNEEPEPTDDEIRRMFGN